MKKYFITIDVYVPSNSLDKLLQEHFVESFRHKIIALDAIQFIENRFNVICELYKKDGGRAKMYFNTTWVEENSIRYSIGTKQKTSMYITLTLIKGEFM